MGMSQYTVGPSRRVEFMLIFVEVPVSLERVFNQTGEIPPGIVQKI